VFCCVVVARHYPLVLMLRTLVPTLLEKCSAADRGNERIEYDLESLRKTPAKNV